MGHGRFEKPQNPGADMTRRAIPSLALFSAVVLVLTSTTATAQSPYGGSYQEVSPSEGGSWGGSSGSSGFGREEPTPTPLPTPTPYPRGSLALSVQPSPATVGPDETLELVVTMTAFGFVPGEYTIAALELEPRLGSVRPSRTSMSAGGTWTVRLHAGEFPGTYPLLFVAQDVLGNHSSASAMVSIEITDELIVQSNAGSFFAQADTAELRLRHKSWIEKVRFRTLSNPRWLQFLAEDIYRDSNWQAEIASATRIDRQRLNISHTLPQPEGTKSYLDIEPIMSRYWADGGMSLSMATANRIGDVFAVWRSSQGLVVTTSAEVAGALRVTTPGIKIGNVLNGVGATMILLDFWANMSNAETPVEAREAWYKAGYSSLDLTLANIVGNTFGSTAALPGMMVSYILTNAYDTLIGGHKSCWFKRMIRQAVDADLLSESIHDTRAVENVKEAMKSPRGLKGTLMDWWGREAPTWAGMMGGCGNWELAEARGYREAFVDRIMRTTEVEVDGKIYHPWSFYYSVSRMLVLDRRREMARDAAENLRKVEAAYISSLAQKRYRGGFRIVSGRTAPLPMANVLVRPLELDDRSSVRTDSEGWFTLEVRGHNFSPDGDILVAVTSAEKDFVFVLPQTAFAEVTP